MTSSPDSCTGCPKFPEALPVPTRFLLYDQDKRQWAQVPKIVTLCGSSRFIDIMAVCGWLLEREEKAIAMGLHLLPGWYGQPTPPNHLAEAEGVAAAMDALHLRKVEMADEIFVVNVDHYMGDSTLREVEHAIDLRKPIRWYTDDPIGRAADTLLQDAIKRRNQG